MRLCWLASVSVVLLGSCGGGGSTASLPSGSSSSSSLPPSVGSTSTTTEMSAASMSSRLLSGTFPVPGGFGVVSLNPLIPADTAPYGAVDAIVQSPTGERYDVFFSPVVTPCGGVNCASPTQQLKVGDAEPAYTAVTFAPDIGVSALCGYNDSHQAGCDTITRDEYIAVRGATTSEAVAVLRAAVAYVRSR